MQLIDLESAEQARGSAREGLDRGLVPVCVQAAMLCNADIDNFYLTNEEIQEGSPSRQDGIDAATESTLRHYGAELVQKAGILLGCPQAVMVTGQVLLQRFYCKKSLKEYNIRVGAACMGRCLHGRAPMRDADPIPSLVPPCRPQRMAAACTYLSCKLEESNVRLRDVIMTFDRLFRRAEGRPLAVLEPGTKVRFVAVRVPSAYACVRSHTKTHSLSHTHTHAHAHRST